MKKILFGIFVVGIIFLSGCNQPPSGKYDEFAKCITEKGAVEYGAYWCLHCQKVKNSFGDSFKYVNYHEHQELPGIKKTPTWVVNGEWYENVQPFDRLAALTGCKL